MTDDLTRESELIAEAAAGDFSAFEALYNLHKNAIYRTAFAIAGNRSTAEEILQETFLRAYKNLGSLRQDISLAPWLYRVAVNLAYDLSAKDRRGLSVINAPADWLIPPTLTSPEKNVEERELQDMLCEIINRLEIKQRTTLVLFYLQDFSLQEVAEIMDCPMGTVKSRLYYARTNLRRELLADGRIPGGLVYEFT